MCRRKTVSEKVRTFQLYAVKCAAACVCNWPSRIHATEQQVYHLQDFLDAVTKVIKGLSKFSATPAYMVRFKT